VRFDGSTSKLKVNSAFEDHEQVQEACGSSWEEGVKRQETCAPEEVDIPLALKNEV
jgi:hypothetical protein